MITLKVTSKTKFAQPKLFRLRNLTLPALFTSHVYDKYINPEMSPHNSPKTNSRIALSERDKTEVYRIAALLDGGASVEQVLRDYPSLSREHIETAKAYAQTNPKQGRPYPRTSVKRALQGAGLEALDAV
ncbi:MAG: DUF433 domain-containing protein [Nevskiaceae bacterium]|jgi:hypothetical protein|nr:DUF433 domain-containing protein [Nevskiaceae bacterium]